MKIFLVTIGIALVNGIIVFLLIAGGSLVVFVPIGALATFMGLGTNYFDPIFIISAVGAGWGVGVMAFIFTLFNHD